MTGNGETAAGAHWLQALRTRACEVDAWSRRHWHADDLARSTRSSALRRPGDDAALVTASAVEEVARRRAAVIQAEPPIGGEAPGRVLAFDPGQSLSDGAAALESRGFFDDDNTPPWDCWLVFVEGDPRVPDRWTAFDAYLLCWIPASLLELVARAVEVNPEACLRWADELAPPTLEAIDRALRRHLALARSALP